MLEELPYWLALWRVPGVGPSHFRLITDRYPSMMSFFNLSVEELEQTGLSQRQSQMIAGFQRGTERKLLEGVTADLDWLDQSAENAILSWADDDYPPLLREI